MMIASGPSIDFAGFKKERIKSLCVVAERQFYFSDYGEFYRIFIISPRPGENIIIENSFYTIVSNNHFLSRL